MKKTLALLLASSALLVACGAEEPEAAEETANESATEVEVDENTAEEVDQAENQADEPDGDKHTESGEDVDYGEVDDDMYFSIHYHQGDIQVENRLEDASSIAGLHKVEFPEEYSLNRYFPQETFIEIKEDGRATILSYELVELSYNAETDTYQDENLNAYIAGDNDDKYGDAEHLADFLATKGAMQHMYIDESNNLELANVPIPTNVEMATGYMIQEYGEIQFRKVEEADVHLHLDKDGEVVFSSLLNSVTSFVSTGYEAPTGDTTTGPEVVSPFELTLETATLTEVSRDAVRLPFLVHSEGLRSASQTWDIVSRDYNERVEQAMQIDAFADDPSQPNLKSHSELMHFLFGNDRDFGVMSIEIADDPSDYVGYTQDNTEIVPDVVFVNARGDARTLREDGTIWAYNSENGTWDRAEYSFFKNN